MNQYYNLPKNKFDQFFEILKSDAQVFAPVKVSDKSYSFKQVTSHHQIAFEALRTILPPKKFFYPPVETIITYDKDGAVEHNEAIEYKVIFGVHPCDLAGLGIMDTIFAAGPADSHYLQRRAACLIVGLSCMPDKHCFCQSMGTDCAESGYDLFLTDIDDDYLLEARTAAGQAMLERVVKLISKATDSDQKRASDFWQKRSKAFTNGFECLNLRSLMEQEADNKIWKELGDRCLSCGNCTPVCPTCYCFDLVDIASLDGETGQRQRQWDSCQLTGFATVGGDFNFRPTPVDRLKFWYQHKLHGFEDPYGFKTCVGCGRCTESCPSGIDDIVNVVKGLQIEREAN